MLNDGFLFEVFIIPLAIIRLGFAIAMLYVFIYEMESYLMILAAQLKQILKDTMWIKACFSKALLDITSKIL